MKDNALQVYWHAYGGWRALVTSQYLYTSVVLTAVMFPTWSKPTWWEDPLGILPDMLGFTLGGYAMWMAIGDDRFRALISGRESETASETSGFMDFSASFVHFILLQVIAIVLGLLAKSLHVPFSDLGVFEERVTAWPYELTLLFWALGYFVFVYALISAVAATFALFQVSNLYDIFRTKQRANEKGPSSSEEGG